LDLLFLNRNQSIIKAARRLIDYQQFQKIKQKHFQPIIDSVAKATSGCTELIFLILNCFFHRKAETSPKPWRREPQLSESSN
jgi:hypothetical protein